MFARSAFKCAAPLRQGIRTYATEAPAKTSSTATPWIVGAAAAVAAYGGYTYLGKPNSVPAAKAEAQKAIDTVAVPATKTFTGGEQGFVDLKLASAEKYNHNTKKFRFEFPDKEAVSGLNIASAIITKFKTPDMEKPVIRPYTPVSDEGEKGFLDLLVKVYPNGAMSEHLFSMKPGDTLSFKGPIPKYPWTPNKHKHITLIAGGTGITPMYQLTRTIFSNPEDKTKVSLVFGNIAEEDILLKSEFDQLEKEFPQRFRAFHVLNKPPKDWAFGKGNISAELLKEVIPDPSSENIKVFVCGPPGLANAISGAKPSPQDQGELSGMLKELGYSKEQVFKF